MYHKESTEVAETKEERMGGSSDDNNSNNKSNINFFDVQDTEADKDDTEADEDDAETHMSAKKPVKKGKKQKTLHAMIM